MSTMYNLKLLCEYNENPLGVDNKTPCFSWLLQDAPQNAAQSAFRISVSSMAVGGADMWDSGKVKSTESAFIPYAGKALKSRTRYFWRLWLWDESGAEAGVSETAWFETAFMDEKEWQAKWIGLSRLSSNPLFRRQLSIKPGLDSARVYVTGLSAYELFINGKKVNKNMLEPSWTDYAKHLFYNTIDVTPFLREGQNVMTVLMGMVRYKSFALLLELHLRYRDDTEEVICSGRDDHWRVYTKGYIVSRMHWPMMAIYYGEKIDGRLKNPQLDDPLIPNAGIENMYKPIIANSPGGRLVAQRIEPIRAIREYPAVSVTEPKPGVFVADFGQNMAGWTRLTVKGTVGQLVTVKHGEMLYDNGTLNQENLRLAQNREEYILGGGDEVFEPHFTYHGFRYAQVEGFPGTMKPEHITAVLARNDVPIRAHFSCSAEILNRIHHVMMMTEESNMHGVPTDCPQRDERLGWTNEGTIRAETSLMNFNGINFFRKWEGDIADTQTPLGTIADIAPDISGLFGGNPADGVASCFQLIPWLLYQHYGDRETMARHYDGIKAWTDYKKLVSDNGIVDYFYYADWTSPIIYSKKDSPQSAITPGELINTGFWLWENQLMAQVAKTLDKKEDAAEFEKQAAFIARAFNEKYLSEKTGYYEPGSQAAQVLPLWLGIVPKEYIDSVVSHLVEDIKEKNYTHSVGNQCWKMLPEVLCDYGHADAAFRILTNTAYPSIGFMLENGATTLWERWEKLESSGMNSHNQPSFGSVDVWFYKYLAGIKTTGPGFSDISIRPFVPGDLDSAEACIDTIRGKVASSWKKEGNKLELTVTIPWNSRARIELPPGMDGKKAAQVSLEDGSTARELVFERPCGTWRFTVQYE